ncbi:23S rRNA pseudouridine(2604) synthase RluF [Algoriphagus sp.]|uniref:23S rRNA pseudouridine(2604) synthase RluF n=1 Tax=Algoriphagus sp. TaxID=1872435 RepID=UPI00328505DB
MEEDQHIRINKYLSEVGFCSRRAADKLLEEGRITINGKVPELGTKVGPIDVVAVDGESVGKPKQVHTYIAFNKPVGIVSTTDTKGEKDNIIDYIGHPQRIFPIGRLDKDSEGLIFLTSEGDIVNKILRSKNNHEKEYIVTVDRPVNDEFIRLMGAGVPILDTVTDACRVERISKFKFRIILKQGLNRQIRRMCEHFGFKVTQLKRIRIMNVHLDIPVGKWRDLTENEMAEINEMIADSSKTFD